MSGIDPLRRRHASDQVQQSTRVEQAAVSSARDSTTEERSDRDTCEVYKPGPFDGVFRKGELSAIDGRAPANRIGCATSVNATLASADQPATPRQDRLIQDLEQLRIRGESWRVVRARLSHEEPSDLQILYRAPGMKEWFGAIATPSQLVDTVERMGGPLAQQMDWLTSAGVKLAPRDARRDLVLSPDDQARLERFDQYRSIAELEAEIKTANDEKPIPTGDQILDTEAAIEHVARLGKLYEQRRVALREAGLDEALWKREKEAFSGLFRAYAVTTARAMLKNSKRWIEAQHKKYGKSEAIETLKKDVLPLVEKAREAVELHKKYIATLRKDGEEGPRSPAAFERFRQAEAERDALRAQLAETHAILKDPETNPEALIGSTVEARQEIDRVVRARLEAIQETHRNIDEDTTSVFNLDRVMSETKRAMGIVEGSAADLVIQAAADRLASSESIKNWAAAGITIGLGLVTGVGGAIGLAATALGTSLGVLSSIDSAHQYSVEANAARTDFDRARSLSSKEPSAFWLAVDIASTVLDVGAFAKTFTSLHETAAAALRARSAADLEDARASIAAIAGTAPQGSVSNTDDLVRSSINAVERERSRIVLLEGHPEIVGAIRAQHPHLDHGALAGLIQLDDATRAAVLRTFAAEPRALARLGRLIDASPDAARGFERLRGVVDEKTFAGLAKDIATRRDQDRARALIERLGNPRVDAGDEREIAHALASRESTSGKVKALEKFARERLPVTRADAEAFAQKHRVPIVVNEAGSSRDVRIYFTARDGLVDDIRIEVGARATLADLEGHAATVQQIAVYRGLLRRAARLVDSISGAPRPGTAAYVAAREIEKLPGRIRAWQRELAGTVTPERAEILRRDIQALERQLEEHRHVFASGSDAPGRAFVAALDAESDRIELLREWPAYGDVAQLEGKKLDDVLANAELRRTFDAHYHQSGRIDGANARRISRHNGHTGDVPLLREQEDGTLRFVPGRDADPPILLPQASTAEVIAFFERSSQSWTKWRDVLVSEGVMSEREIAALMKKSLTGKNAPKTVEQLRDVLKNATRDRLVSHCFTGAKDAATTHTRLRAFVSKLNPADQGSVAELWYCRYSEVYLGRKVEPHVHMRPADNPGLEAARIPDNLHIEGRELGEVKSTADKLSARDKAQIDAMLKAMEQGSGGAAVVVKNGAAHSVDRLRLTFTDPAGAFGSADAILGLLTRSQRLTVEVFDTSGQLQVLRQADLRKLRRSGTSLHAKLKEWAGT
jgi:hypothetical protein